jgi:hypothetical protein
MPESFTHKELRRHAIERLVSEGYKEIQIDKRIGEDVVVDIFGKKGSEKAVVECYVFPNDVEKKLDAATEAGVDRFVIAIPEEVSVPMVHSNVEVWKFEVELVGTPSKKEALATACFPLREDLDEFIVKTAKELDESKSAFIRKAVVLRLALLGKLEGDEI